ncbi:TIGR03084 family metal-binding protein [Kitasatospora sp. NBC_01287]|uniref:TIGR03084 family metal-binding protein n=1 Tax=Kitasatospora sp. NBC_01287 TaxID=2903573 RepID=UPI00224D9118|nr:TIGR03084 family metal-binding protein [Kitasatospora sp. NBC_01287]MCX4745217.1 TIGR03084 family metal-binding protein [Kitasatospora sp. NBC_01287]
MTDTTALLADLRAEGDELAALVEPLTTEGWADPTPAPGWTIAHQIAHLAWTDSWTLRSVREPAGFQPAAAELLTGQVAFEDVVDHGAAQGAALPPAELLHRWQAGRAEVLAALAEVPPETRLPWFGPPMKAPSMATARLMETWAHGEDVAEALGVAREPGPRLRHVAHLGVRTMGFAFAAHGQPVPTEPVRVELTGPAGEAWSWGPEEAADRISGPALDFCLLVTQRRHPDDLALTVTGPVARSWLPIAQVFAGPPGAGRAPREN